jgi:hypothetical protein
VVAEALEGLDSVRAVSVDLDDDRFDIRFLPDAIDAEELAGVIIELGYSPEVLIDFSSTNSTSAGLPEQPVAFRATDAELRRLMARAEQAGKPLLLDVYTPG